MTINTKPGPGRPAIGGKITVSIGDGLLARVDAATKPGEKRAAAIRRLLEKALETQESAMPVTLYETNSDILVIARGDDAWTLHPGADLAGRFADDAAAWINGDWEPNEGDGQTPTHLDDLKAVATWSPRTGLALTVRRDSLGGAARDYIGDKLTRTIDSAVDHVDPTITL